MQSSRCFFTVGNIPYEATDENLREIFSQAGPVLSFRLVYDRESGKPKGYGFCEYKDIETAQSAMRNLNGVELHGRNLRVDSAASEKGKEESKGSAQLLLLFSHIVLMRFILEIAINIIIICIQR